MQTTDDTNLLSRIQQLIEAKNAPSGARKFVHDHIETIDAAIRRNVTRRELLDEFAAAGYNLSPGTFANYLAEARSAKNGHRQPPGPAKRKSGSRKKPAPTQ